MPSELKLADPESVCPEAAGPNSSDRSGSLETRVRLAPTTAGVYWMCDARDRVLYVGKAVNIRSRLSKHLHATGHLRQKVQRNLRRVRDIRWIATANEAEALRLEESLIRDQQPPLNVVLPHYSFLCLTTSEPFPRFYAAPRMVPGDGNLYFGSYPDRAAMTRLLQAVLPVFRIRGDRNECRWDGGAPITPCHRLELGWCSAPCSRETGQEEYQKDAAGLARLLQGRDEERAPGLAEETDRRIESIKAERRSLEAESDVVWSAMEDAADALQFEEAARLRNRWNCLQRRSKNAGMRIRKLRKQRAGLQRAGDLVQVVQPALPDLDVWAFASDDRLTALAILPYRSGRLCISMQAMGVRGELSEAVRRHYRSAESLPPRIVLADANISADGIPPAAAPRDKEQSDQDIHRLFKEIWEAAVGRRFPGILPEPCFAEDDPALGPASALACFNARRSLAARIAARRAD